MRIKYKKYKNSLFKRFGRGFPVIVKGNHFLIWVHAVSVGEAKAASSFIRHLKAKIPDTFVILSSVTETGHEEAKRSVLADAHVYLPFDFSCILRPVINSLQPDLVIFCESDFWYNFIRLSKEQGAKIAVINGKISTKSQRLFEKFPGICKKIFSPIDLFCLQSGHYQERFQTLGIPKEKMCVTGNLKFDDTCVPMTVEEIEEWRKQLNLQELDQVVVIGSTHDPEEKQLLGVMKIVWKKNPHLKVVLVPRHPERFDEVAEILREEEIPCWRFSLLPPKGDVRVILMDKMGLLRKCYQVADLAIVGGSFYPNVGGHNIIEPSWFQVPVLFGPFMYKQPELVELVKRYSSGRQVSLEESSTAIENLLCRLDERQMMGSAGLKLVQDLQGATKRVFNKILPLIEEKKKEKATKCL